MNIQTEKSIQNTYINPIVLPDYPCLEVKSVRKLSDWGRGDKKLVSEGDLMRESGVPEAEIAPMEGVFSPGYGCVPESDVRATADPSCYCFDGRYYLYVTSGMVYDSDDLVHWTPHYDETWLPISAPMAPTVEKWNGKFYAAANRTPLFVSDSPLGPWEKVGEWTAERTAVIRHRVIATLAMLEGLHIAVLFDDVDGAVLREVVIDRLISLRDIEKELDSKRFAV